MPARPEKTGTPSIYYGKTVHSKTRCPVSESDLSRSGGELPGKNRGERSDNARGDVGDEEFSDQRVGRTACMA